MKSWIRYQIVHCPMLWNPAATRTKKFSKYRPRWRWVSKLLEWLK